MGVVEVNCPRCGRAASVKLPIDPAAATTDVELDLVNNAPPDGRSVGECPGGHTFVVYYYAEAGFEYLHDG